MRQALSARVQRRLARLAGVSARTWECPRLRASRNCCASRASNACRLASGTRAGNSRKNASRHDTGRILLRTRVASKRCCETCYAQRFCQRPPGQAARHAVPSSLPRPPPSRALLPPTLRGIATFFFFTQGSAALHGAHGGLTCKPALPGYASWVHALAARIRHRGVAGRGWRHVADGRGEVDAFVCSYVGAAARYAVAACAPRSRLCLLRAGSWPRLGNPRWATRSQVDRQTAMYT